MNQEQIESIKIMVAKGKRSLTSAEKSIENEDYDFASSRAYYAVFYFMQAILSTEGLTFSKHSASIAEFGRSFIKTGIFPKEYGKYIQNLFKERQEADYDYYANISLEEAEENLRIAREICEKIEVYLNSIISKSAEDHLL
jgi:uncharacterized protein (UPF0332 family)